MAAEFIRLLSEVGRNDVSVVGGKAASLGEMISNLSSLGVHIPDGFVVTTAGWQRFVEHNNLGVDFQDLLENIDVNDNTLLQQVSGQIRSRIEVGHIPQDLQGDIEDAYHMLENEFGQNVDVIVRSSAIAEDLADASFAGEYESFTHIRGVPAILETLKHCFASLFSSRAIAYRAKRGFSVIPEGFAVIIQKMVRSDKACAGTAFSAHTNSGFRNAIVIQSGWGLGEPTVRGLITPDMFLVSKEQMACGKEAILRTLGTKKQKEVYSHRAHERTILVETTPSEQDAFTLSSQEILEIARLTVVIEEHFSCPIDIEWAKDGDGSEPGMTEQIFIVQARPITVLPSGDEIHRVKLLQKGEVILEGNAPGIGVGQGRVQIILDAHNLDLFEKGNVLVTKMTDPDWVPAMREASAIITDDGGPNCHAALVANEMHKPCIIGTGNATCLLRDGEEITVCCDEGMIGKVYRGILPVESLVEHLAPLRILKAKMITPQIGLILSDPYQAFRESFLPCDGIGLVRMEFILAGMIGFHPMLATEKHPEQVLSPELYERFMRRIRGYPDAKTYFIEKLAESIAFFGMAFWPRPIIARFSDFKTNEYQMLLGSARYEPQDSERNPMIGWRGASRYYSDYQKGFMLECRAIKRVREHMGFTNVKVMLPFCRTSEEVRKVLEVMKRAGLPRGREGLEVYMMVEIPSNKAMISQVQDVIDGFSIGSNDYLQLFFGLDRDNAKIAQIVDERHPDFLEEIRQVIENCKKIGKPVGFCGNAPSRYPEVAAFLARHGIDSISVVPEVVPQTIRLLAKELSVSESP